MFLKNAVVNAGKKFFPEMTFSHLQKQILLQLVFITALKNYINRAITEQNLFTVPLNVKSKARTRKLILVLDMDQTLVYTRRDCRPPHSNYCTAKNEDENMYVQTRPFAKDFLAAASEIFTIYVYTAGDKKYADSVLNAIDTEGVIQRRFYRDSCKKIGGKLIKDLRYLKRVLREKSDMILVDDNTDSIRNNYPFSVAIEPFEGDQNDLHLPKTFKTLLKFYS